MSTPSQPLNKPEATTEPTGSASLGAAGSMIASPRPSVIQLAIKEKAALYAAYIPLFKEGGIFIPSARDYKLGDDIYLLLSLPNEPQRYPLAGKVAWISPARAANNRTQGVGVEFPADEKSRQLKQKIEEILGAHLASDRPTQTI